MRLYIETTIKNNHLLNEDDGGGGDGYGGLMGAVDAFPYGMQFADRAAMADIFITPLVDAWKTIVGKTKELGVATKTLVKVIGEILVTSFIPILQDEYEEIFDKERQELSKIQQEYGQHYKAVFETFDNKDLRMLAFMYDPWAGGAFLSYFGGKAAAKVAYSALNTATGGSLKKIADYVNFKSSDSDEESSGGKKDKRVRAYHPPEGSSEKRVKAYHPPKGTYSSGDWGGGGGGVDEGLIRESKVTPDVIKTLFDKNDDIKNMKSKTQNVVHSSMKQLMKNYEAVMKATTIEGAYKILGQKIPNNVASQLAKASQEEKAKAEQTALNAVKKATKELYSKNIETLIKNALSQGVPESSAYIVDYKKLLNRIKATN